MRILDDMYSADFVPQLGNAIRCMTETLRNPKPGRSRKKTTPRQIGEMAINGAKSGLLVARSYLTLQMPRWRRVTALGIKRCRYQCGVGSDGNCNP